MGNEVKTVITDRSDGPRGNFDAILIRLTPLRIVLTRATRVYLMSLLAALALQGVTQVFDPANGMPVSQFLTVFINAASVAAGPAVVSALWNTVELLAKLDERAPELRA